MDEENMTKSEEQHLSLQKALQQCELVQNMIDISILSLEGLRTKCATSNDLTQKEIRMLEVSISHHHHHHHHDEAVHRSGEKRMAIDINRTNASWL